MSSQYHPVQADDVATAPRNVARSPTRHLAYCERCGYEWFARAASPVRCPHCGSKSWNKPRTYKLEGKPNPTCKPKARGISFTKETAQKAAYLRHLRYYCATILEEKQPSSQETSIEEEIR